MSEPCANVAHILRRAAERSPDDIAVIDLDAPGDGRISYAEQWDRVLRVAGGLRAAGLVPGDRVAMLLRNSPVYIDVFLGAAAAGLVVVPLNVRLLAEDHLHMVRDSGARLLVAEAGLVADRPMVAEVPELGVALVDDGYAGEPAGARRYDELLASGTVGDVVTPRGADDLLSLMYTSGTTGLPKAVMLTHGSWQIETELTVELLRFEPGEITLHMAPLTHGAGFLVLPTFVVGGRNLLARAFSAPRTLALLREEGVTGGFFVPSMVRMLLDADPSGAPIRHSLRRFFYAGSPMDTDTLREAVERFGPVLVQSFGQMESPMFLTLLSSDDHRRAVDGDRPALARSAGRVVPGVDLRLLDDDGNAVPPGTPGEVVVRAPQTMAGYWNRPDATAEALRDGWLHTGDVGYLDDEGCLFLVDRKKDMIITGGSNVYAREVEDVLLSLPDVRDAAVIGTPDRLWGEAVTAVLVAEHGGRPTAAVLTACRDRLAGYRVPKRVVWVDALPRNAYGKVLKRELRERFEKEQRWADAAD